MTTIKSLRFDLDLGGDDVAIKVAAFGPTGEYLLLGADERSALSAQAAAILDPSSVPIARGFSMAVSLLAGIAEELKANDNVDALPPSIWRAIKILVPEA